LGEGTGEGAGQPDKEGEREGGASESEREIGTATRGDRSLGESK
jgi:hypothetical protein